MSANAIGKAKPSFVRSFKAVIWSFFGLRKASDFQEDIQKVSLLHLIFIGLGMVFAFVVGLMFFVRWVVAQ